MIKTYSIATYASASKMIKWIHGTAACCLDGHDTKTVADRWTSEEYLATKKYINERTGREKKRQKEWMTHLRKTTLPVSEIPWRSPQRPKKEDLRQKILLGKEGEVFQSTVSC